VGQFLTLEGEEVDETTPKGYQGWQILKETGQERGHGDPRYYRGGVETVVFERGEESGYQKHSPHTGGPSSQRGLKRESSLSRGISFLKGCRANGHTSEREAPSVEKGKKGPRKGLGFVVRET